MALKVGDRVKQFTNSTGTGDISFTGTAVGFVPFSSVLSSGDTTYYALTENDKFEVGIGTYGDSNMVRTTVLVSSNNNSQVNLGGSGVVFITYPSDRSVLRNLSGQVVVGASGLVFSNGTLVKEAKLAELTDVGITGTPSSADIISFNHTDKALTIGDSTGPTNSNNILIGDGAGSGITSGTSNVVLGVGAAVANNTGTHNVSVGDQSGPYETDYTNALVGSVAIGYQAGSRMRSYATAIGYGAGKSAYETNFVAIGKDAGYQIGSYGVAIGVDSAYALDEDNCVSIGYQAGYSAAGESAVWVGYQAGHSASNSAQTIGIGYQAGKSSSANDSIYIGKSAGQSNSSNDYLYIGNASPSSNGSLIKGDMENKMLAVGAADVTLSDTFYIGIASSSKKGLVVRSAAAQSAVLSDWQTSTGVSVAALSNSGVLTANAVYASGNGIKLANITPDSTTNTLYNVGGSLYFNGTEIETSTLDLAYVSGIAVYASGQSTSFNHVSGIATSLINTSGVANYASGQAVSNQSNITINSAGITYVSGIAVYSSGNSITNATNIIATSGIANYASGQAISNQSSITTNSVGITYVSGIAVYSSGNSLTNATNIVATSGIANYASGQAIANESDILALINASGTATSLIATSGIATYASGQAIANESDIVAVSGIAHYASGHVHNDAYVSGIAAYASGLLTTGGTLIKSGTDGIIIASGIDKYSMTIKSNSDADGVHEYIELNDNDASSARIYKAESYAINIQASGEGGNSFDNVINYSGPADNNIVQVGTGLYINNSTRFIGVNETAPSYGIDVVGLGATGIIRATGVKLGASGIVFSDGTTQTTASAGGVDTYSSGVATYASGQAIANQSNIVAVSGISNYASGQAISNQGNITALLNASGTATSLISSSGIATYASGNSLTNASNIIATSGIANYASGQAILNQAIGNYASGQAISNQAIGNYASGQAIANESDIVATSGIANYASGHAVIANYASGQAIENETIATYASGNSLTNATNIIAVSGIANYASGHVAIANYASGQATSFNTVSGVATSLVATSGIAIYASGQATSFNTVSGVATSLISTSGIATYASGNTANIAFGSNAEGDMLFHNGTSFVRLAKGNDDYVLTMNGNQPNWEESSGGVDAYTSGVATYASGQAIANETDIALVSGIASNRTINFGLNGGSKVPSSGVKRYSCKSPYNGVITGWEIAANSSGNIIFDIWKSSDGLKPEPTDSICNTAFPHCSGQFASNGTLAGWTTAFSQGDIFGIVLNEVQGSGFQQIDLCIKYTDNA